MRFQESVFTTGSTPNQRQIIRPPAQQPYPGDVQQNGLDQTYTGSVQRQSARRSDMLAGPTRNDGTVVPANRPQRSVQTASADTSAFPPPNSGTVTRREVPPPAPAQSARGLDDMSTGSTRTQSKAPKPAPVASGKGGWQSGRGAEVTVRRGETLYNLSRRYGVPVEAIMAVNGLKSADQLQAGQKISIPTYAYTTTAPVSAPDANPKVAAASPTAEKQDRLPEPKQAPERVAVQPPKPRQAEGQSTQTTTSTGSSHGGVYTVAAGDTLWGIARSNGTTTAALKAANGLSSGVLQVGQKLKIPAGGSGEVQTAKAKTSEKVDPIVTGAAGPAHKKADRSQSRDDQEIEETVQKTAAAAPDATGVGRMRWPVRGRVIAGFGGKNGTKKNDGIDISVPEGTPVKAAENGVVIYAGDGLKDFGNTVLVRHEDGLVTVYGHASKLEVSRGDTVKRGQEIARSGMSGKAESPRLHFEVRKDSAPVDPSKYLD